LDFVSADASDESWRELDRDRDSLVSGGVEMKKIQTLLPCLAALSMWTAFAQVKIPILNPKFDMDVLECSPGGSCARQGVTGWVVGPNTNVQKMSATQYPGAPATGLYAVAIGGSPVSSSILQTLGATVQANTTCILSASGHTATPAAGTFVTEQISHESGSAPPQLGKPLQILVISTGTGSMDVQSVELTASN
jgi:hypothetical protein